MNRRDSGEIRRRPEAAAWRRFSPPTRSELNTLSQLVRGHTGLQSDGSRENFLSAGVLRRMHALELDNVSEYIHKLQDPNLGPSELRQLANLLVVHKTSFFRDRGHFLLLERNLLPRLKTTTQPIRIWSAGCSTGQEVYSLAISLHRCGISPDQAHILGTDLSAKALDFARRGVYPASKLEGLEASERKFFEELPDGDAQVSDAMKEYVRFERHNLVDVPYPGVDHGNWDIIFCRNVLIYFSRSTIRSIVGRFHGGLAADGSLFLGACESLFQLSEGFDLEQGGDAFIYRKRLASTAPLRQKARVHFPAPPPSPPKPPTDTRARITQAFRVPLETTLLDAERHRLAGDPDQARLVLLKARETWPAEAGLLSALGQLAFESGAMEEARSWLTSALAREGLDVRNLFLAGLTLFHLGLDTEASEHLRRLLFLERNFALGHYYQGLVASRLGQELLAQRSFRNALSILEKGQQPEDSRLTGLPVETDLIKNACRAKITTAATSGSKGGKP